MNPIPHVSAFLKWALYLGLLLLPAWLISTASAQDLDAEAHEVARLERMVGQDASSAAAEAGALRATLEQRAEAAREAAAAKERQASQWRELAASALQSAADNRADADRWEQDANDPAMAEPTRQLLLDGARSARERAERDAEEASRYEQNALDLADDAAREAQTAVELAALVARLSRLLVHEPPGPPQPETPEVAADGATPRPPAAPEGEGFTISLEDTLGVWRHEEEDWPFVIVQEDPDFEVYATRLEAHTDSRVWKGYYIGLEPGHPGRGGDGGRVIFTYQPRAEEMNPEIPQWAREAVEGELEWKIELSEAGTCGTPRFNGRWYPGEVTWEDSGTGQPGRARVSGRGEPREFGLRKSIDLAFEAFAAPVLHIKLPGAHDPIQHPIDALIKRQPFHVQVVMPEALAREQGETLTVTVRGTIGGSRTTIQLVRGAAHESYATVYSHHREVTIAPRDFQTDDRDPPFLSIPYLLGIQGTRLSLSVANAEPVEFQFGEAVQVVPLYDTWYQRNLARQREAIEQLRAIFGGALTHGGLTAAQREQVHVRLQMLKNLEAIQASGRIHDIIKYEVGKWYLGETQWNERTQEDYMIFPSLVLASDDELAERARHWGTYRGVFTLSHREIRIDQRDGSADPSGIYQGVVWTSDFERASTMAFVEETRSRLRESYLLDEIPKAFSFALYSAVADLSGVGGVYTALSGYDIFGRRVETWERINAAIGVGSGFALTFAGPIAHQQHTLHSPGRIARVGARVRLKEQASLQVRAEGPLPATLRQNQIEAASVRSARLGEAEDPPVKCGRPIAAELAPPPGPPGPLPSPPPLPELRGVTPQQVQSSLAQYGPNFSFKDPLGPPLAPPQRYGTCNVSCMIPDVINATSIPAKVLSEISVTRILFRNGIVDRVQHNVLRDGYRHSQAERFAKLMGAETWRTASGRRLTPEQMDAWMRHGWRIKDVVLHRDQPPGGDRHAVVPVRFIRNAKGDITHIEFYDPAYGRIGELPICDYVDIAQPYSMLGYRWETQAAPPRPTIDPPRRPTIEYPAAQH